MSLVRHLLFNFEHCIRLSYATIMFKEFCYVIYGKIANFYHFTWFSICCFYLTARYTIHQSTTVEVEISKTMTVMLGTTYH